MQGSLLNKKPLTSRCHSSHSRTRTIAIFLWGSSQCHCGRNCLHCPGFVHFVRPDHSRGVLRKHPPCNLGIGKPRATAGLVLVLLCRPEKSKLWRKLRGFVRCNVFFINLTRFTLDANPGNQTIWKLTRCVDLGSRKAHKTASQRDQSCVEADLARLLMQSCVIVEANSACDLFHCSGWCK